MQVGVREGVHPLEYPVLAGGCEQTTDCDRIDPLVRIRELESEIALRDKQHAEELEAVRLRAIAEGRSLSGSEGNAWRDQCARQLAAALGEFRAQWEDYLARAEHEVVRLALAIAQRILHREAQMDPLLLSGAVRVALGQLSEATEVRLRVPQEQRDLWAEMLRLMPALAIRPVVVADPEMHGSEAVLEADLGTLDLGVRAQIGEIERGFFDLLEVRKGAKPGHGASGEKA